MSGGSGLKTFAKCNGAGRELENLLHSLIQILTYWFDFKLTLESNPHHHQRTGWYNSLDFRSYLIICTMCLVFRKLKESHEPGSEDKGLSIPLPLTSAIPVHLHISVIVSTHIIIRLLSFPWVIAKSSAQKSANARNKIVPSYIQS